MMMIREFIDILWQRRPLTSFDSRCFADFLSRYSSVCWWPVGIFGFFIASFLVFFLRIFSSVFSLLFHIFFPFLRGGTIPFFPSNGCLNNFFSHFFIYIFFWGVI